MPAAKRRSTTSPTSAEPKGSGRPARRARSSLVAACLSFIFPGAGQLYLGRWVSAVVFAVPTVVVLGWAALQLSRGLVYLALSMLDQSYALTVLVLAVAVTAWRLVAIAHPIVVQRPSRMGPRPIAVLAALVIATLAMGDVVASNAYDAFKLPEQVAANNFVDATDSPGPSLAPGQTWAPDTGDWWDEPSPTPVPGYTCPPYYNPPQANSEPVSVAAALSGPAPLLRGLLAGPGDPTEGATPELTPTPEPTPSATSEPTAAATVEPTTEPSPTGTPAPSPSAGHHQRLTVLLVGVDYIAGRNHALTDTLMLVSIDLETRAVAMISVPRDTSYFPFYWGGQAPLTFKINTLVKAVASGKIKSPDSPMVTLANEIGYLVGVKVDYYAAIDMAGFTQLIDLVGGVDVNNPRVLNDPFTCTYVPAGRVHLDGAAALRYVRSRESSSDYYRAGRQQLVMMALRDKMATPAILPKLGSLLDVAGKSIATNFPLNTAKDYVDVAEHVTSISRCVLGSPYNYHPPSSETNGSWTSRLKLDQVANLSVYLFGADSRYYGQPGLAPAPCQNRY
jgi:LCP family protein required for cell wall assembly